MTLEHAAIVDEAVCLLRRYIRIDTTNPPGNEAAGARFLQAFLKQEGIDATLYESAPGRANLYARLKGDGSKKALMLVHHIDVVPAQAAEWSVPPFEGEIRDGYLWGRGTMDIKGPGIMEVLAFVMLKRLGVPLARDVVLAAMVIVNDTTDAADDGSLDACLLAYARDKHAPVDAYRALPRQSARPFDSAWKYARVTVARPDPDEPGRARIVSYLKGAPELVSSAVPVVTRRSVDLAKVPAGYTDHVGARVTLVFFPTEFQVRWSQCSATADFFAEYFAAVPACRPETEDARAEFIGTVSYVVNELVENAVKFSIGERVEITVGLDDDELVEVTPKSIRLRKRYLDHNTRKRFEKVAAAVAED